MNSGLFSFVGAGKVAVICTSSIERIRLFTAGTRTVDGNCSGSMPQAAGCGHGGTAWYSLVIAHE